jgi:hypothetical protein
MLIEFNLNCIYITYILKLMLTNTRNILRYSLMLAGALSPWLGGHNEFVVAGG